VAITTSLPQFPTAEDISVSIQQAIQKLNSLATNFNTGGLTRTYIEAIATALGSDASGLPGSTVQGAYEILKTLQTAMFLTTATDYWLDYKAADFGVTRKDATAANTAVIFTAPTAAPSGGNTIYAGTQIQANLADPTASPVIFQTTEDVVIPAGLTISPAVPVQAVNTGSGTNVPANAINTVLTGPTSYTVYNPAAATGGTDRESDDALRGRALQAVANASQCTLSALVGAALTYDGITSATTLDLTADDGVTFQLGNCLVFCDDGSGDLGNSGNANHASLVAFQNDLTIGKWRSAGVVVHAFGSLLLPTTVAFSITISDAYLSEGYSAASVQTAVQAAVFGLIQQSGLGTPIRLSDVVEVSRDIPGVSNVIVSSIFINGNPSDLIPAPQYVSRCVNGLTDVTVTIASDTVYA
jgi:uncharacterized phage protein gp47/JayE